MGNILDLYSFDFPIVDFNLCAGSRRIQESEICHIDRGRLHIKAEAEFTEEGKLWVRMLHSRCFRTTRAEDEDRTKHKDAQMLNPGPDYKLHTDFQSKNNPSDDVRNDSNSRLYPSLYKETPDLVTSGTQDLVKSKDSDSALVAEAPWVKTNLRVKATAVCQDCSSRDLELGERELEISGESGQWRWLWDVTGGPMSCDKFRHPWLLNREDRLLLRFTIVVWEDKAVPSTITMVRNIFTYRPQRALAVEQARAVAAVEVEADIEWRGSDDDEAIEDGGKKAISWRGNDADMIN